MTKLDSLSYQCTHIHFRAIHPRGMEIVPVNEAWDFYERKQCTHQDYLPGDPSYTIERATFIDEDSYEFTPFAKSWSVWDFKRKVHRLVRIGFGAYGDSFLSPIKNPDPEVHGKIDRVYEVKYSCWTHGINAESYNQEGLP